MASVSRSCPKIPHTPSTPSGFVTPRVRIVHHRIDGGANTSDMALKFASASPKPKATPGGGGYCGGGNGGGSIVAVDGGTIVVIVR